MISLRRSESILDESAEESYYFLINVKVDFFTLTGKLIDWQKHFWGICRHLIVILIGLSLFFDDVGSKNAGVKLLHIEY